LISAQTDDTIKSKTIKGTNHGKFKSMTETTQIDDAIKGTAKDDKTAKSHNI
jgi:hypothetical protein